jgi:hypothetical protein
VVRPASTATQIVASPPGRRSASAPARHFPQRHAFAITVGTAANTGTITAGGADNTAGEIVLNTGAAPAARR